ncbi:MAG: tripartite tricarboxylate transporter TctB family protein [Thermodesulfobacteriota bacterium]
MTIQERRAAVLAILFGAAVVSYTIATLQVGSVRKPGPGMFPAVCGAGIVAVAGFWLAGSLKRKAGSSPFWTKGSWKVPLIAVFLMLVYTATMERLGYTLSTLVFLVVWQSLIEREPWVKTMIVSALACLFMYLIFVYLLRVSVPKGFVGF